MVQDNQSESGANAIINSVTEWPEKSQKKLQVLCTLYNSVSFVDIKISILLSVFQVAKNDQELDVVLPILQKLESWLNELEVDEEKRADLYLCISECGFQPDVTLVFLRKYLSIKPDATLAKKAIHLALGIRSCLLFEDIISLDAVQSLKGEPIWELLNIFTTKSLVDYNAFVKKHPKILSENGLSPEALLEKIRLLTLDAIANVHVGKTIKYEVISKALDIPTEKVEFWVIDGN
jgi:translation initiation factor 3 subunit M